LWVVAAVTRGEARVGNGRAPVGDGARKVGRRGSLPNGRSVVGGFLVAVAVLGVFAAYQDAQIGPVNQFVAAAHDLAPGTVLTADDVKLTAVDLPKGMDGRGWPRTQDVVGQITVAPLVSGDLVLRSAVAPRDAADTRFQVSIPLEKARALDGALTPGERVDVLVTYKSSGTDSGFTDTVAPRAEVIRIDRGSGGALSTGSGDVIVVLAVGSANEAKGVTHGSQEGKVTLVRATGTGSSTSSSGKYRPDIGGG
jgi:Flp pilus assembly protein CpaB